VKKPVKMKKAKGVEPKVPKEPHASVDAPAEPTPPRQPRGMAVHDGEEHMAQLRPECERLADLRRDKDRLEAELVLLNKELEAQSQKLVDRFERMGLVNIKVDGLGIFYRTTMAQPKVIDEAGMFADLESRGMGDIIRRTVNYQTLRGTINELREKGAPELRGVDIFEMQAVRWRKQ
jgi:hypothetical protein